jgi:transcriptional regulator GlxA family with amidase domain
LILGVPVYEGVNLLDVAGPWEMFNWVDESLGLKTLIVSQEGGPVTTMNGIRFNADTSFAKAPPLDVLWVPGGSPDALSRIMKEPGSPYLVYLQGVAATAKWVCSACEGALLLARAGLLDGHRATTHWAFLKCLQSFPKIDVVLTHPRWVVSGNRLTGGGISSGLDESLQLITILFGSDAAADVQLTTEYFPDPPKGVIPAPGDCPVSW